MNIFIFDEDLELNARSHPDKLVVKMPLEASQIINNAIISLGFAALQKKNGESYGVTHRNHPSCLWLKESRPNLIWGIRYFDALVREYERRYCKVSAYNANLAYLQECFSYKNSQTSEPLSYSVVINPFWIKCFQIDGYISSEITASSLKSLDLSSAVKLYRLYLKYAKTSYSEWRYSEPPAWWMEDLNNGEYSSKFHGRFSKLSYGLD